MAKVGSCRTSPREHDFRRRGVAKGTMLDVTSVFSTLDTHIFCLLLLSCAAVSRRVSRRVRSRCYPALFTLHSITTYEVDFRSTTDIPNTFLPLCIPHNLHTAPRVARLWRQRRLDGPIYLCSSNQQCLPRSHLCPVRATLIATKFRVYTPLHSVFVLFLSLSA